MARSREGRFLELRTRPMLLTALAAPLAWWHVMSLLCWCAHRPKELPLALLLHRRCLIALAPPVAAAAASLTTQQPAGARGGEGCGKYPVCKAHEDWKQSLSTQQFFILRRDGTEAPRSSPLLREQRKGQFQCAACNAPLFSSADKFDSKTGWPSFGRATSNVEVEDSWLEAVTGSKVKCARCGGHIGERFSDGAKFPGTMAARTGRHYCVNGAGLIFIPADGSEARTGEAPAADAVSYWEGRPWRMIDGGLRPI